MADSIQKDVSASAREGRSAQRVTHILAYAKEPERSSMRFEQLADNFPNVSVNVASSLAEAEPFLAEADILITHGSHLDADAELIYRRAKKLRWVQCFGTGVDNIKGHPALPGEVVITNVHGVHGPQLSEAAFAAMLSFARRLPELLRNQADAKWEKPASDLLCGKTVGILGLGAIANELAPRCKAFGMHLVGITKSRRIVPQFDRIYTTNEIEQAVANVDYLIVLTPHTPQTHHVVNADVLRAMRPSAVLINLARGGIVDEAALLAALDAGQIGGAALDVFEVEPLPASSRFWSHPRVLVTPHAAGFHTGYPDQAYTIVSQNLAVYLEGGAAALANRA